MLCPKCSSTHISGQPLNGVLEVELSGTLESNDPLDFLPVERQYFPAIPVGNTPLWHPAPEVPSENLLKKYGFPDLYLKDDGANPTGSLKDRASFLVAAFARKHGISEVVVASTGNAGSSMAGVGAAAGLKVKLFLPKTAPPAKMIQALQYGADLVLADKNYDQAFSLSLEYSNRHGGMNRNTAYNPMTIEGKKTVAFELFNQLKKAPDHVFVSVGDGVILSGVYKGFRDLLQLGRIEKIPVVHAVQASGSDAICRAMESGSFEGQPEIPVADSISVDIPSNGHLAVKNLKTFDGHCFTVTDEEILSAQKELSSSYGLFSEPAAATAYAGFLKQKAALDSSETCVVLLTGNGLKDINSATAKIVVPEKSINSLDELE